MNKVVLTGPGSISVDKERLSPLSPLMTVKACGVCMSDQKAYLSPPSGMKLPMVLGHEIAGTLEVDVPSQKLKKGDRVVPWPAVSCGKCKFCKNSQQNLCPEVKIFGYHLNGGFQTKLCFEKSIAKRVKLFEIPNNISFSEAVFAEPLACVLNALNKLISPPKSCLIIGAGVMGRLAAKVIRNKFSCRLFIDDLKKERLNLAANPEELYQGEKVDLIFLAASSYDALSSAINSLDAGGSLLLFSGMPRNASPYHIPHNTIHRKEQHLIGAYGCTPETIEDALGLMGEGVVEVKDLIHAEISPEKLEKVLTEKSQSPSKSVVVFD